LAQPIAVEHVDSENGEAVEAAEIFKEDKISGRRFVNDIFCIVNVFDSLHCHYWLRFSNALFELANKQQWG